MLRLEKIEIAGFKSVGENVRVLFSPSNVSIIYGQNGSGKTSLLKVLHAVFSQDESTLLENEITRIIIDYSQGSEFKRISIEKIVKDIDHKNEIKSYYDWSELAESDLFDASSLSLGVDRGMTNQTIKIDPRIIYDFFRSPQGRKYSREMNVINLSEELSDHIRIYQSRYRNRTNNTSLEFEKRTYICSLLKWIVLKKY